MFKLGVPRRLSVLVEGESLLNDGTAIVFFTLALGLVTGRVSFRCSDLVVDFVRVVGAGSGRASSSAGRLAGDPCRSTIR